MYFESWNDILKIYYDTTRYSMLKKQGKLKIFWGLLLVYSLVSVFSLYLIFIKSIFFFISISLIMLTALAINQYLNKIQGSNQSKYNKYMPLSEHTRHHRYLLFYDELREKLPHFIEKIPCIIEWNEIRSSQFKKISLISHPFIIAGLGGAISLLSASELIAYNSIIFSFLAVRIILFIAIILEMLTEFWFMKERAIFEVSKFLQWALLENQMPTKP
nr:hypothetical protein [uncultured Halomonas sp.]